MALLRNSYAKDHFYFCDASLRQRCEFELYIQDIRYIGINLSKFYFNKIKFVIFQVCAINLIFVLISVIMINFRRNIQICTVNIIAAIIGILMVGKMLYQIQYINHSNWNINCTVSMNICMYNRSNFSGKIFILYRYFQRISDIAVITRCTT